MLCKAFGKQTKAMITLIIVGVFMVVFGIVKAITLPETAYLESRIAGMVLGIGSAFAVSGVIRLIRIKVASPEKLKLREIEEKDERNIQITRIAYTISSMSATILLAALVFIFTFMNSITESYICLAALLLQLAIFLISRIYYNKKM
jgi:hypothetical protein